MTHLSRRVFVTAAAASLLVSCAEHGGDGASAARPRGTHVTPHPSAGSSNASAAPSGSVPVRLRIPGIGVDTPVMRLGLAQDGSVQVPPITARDQAGWYRSSPAPGQTGPSVILGHVTVGPYGDGVFRRLDRLRRGDEITVRLENGTSAEFTVTSVRTVAKAEFPTEAVYGDVDRPELRLITCGGPRTGDGYLDNVIVFAASHTTRR
ncbi:class F sortase [Streptomyces griseoluteus]|uniref:Class F sortase n=1 Tax=Streptomyces griseoluteus TaxID=29306 RepID=A0A4Z1DNR3_STRGP|nr:class F sortase [Streptomyces griseoluteus]TGN84722.1 class F sortase [Streptomyces griseoluteus]GHF00852.1 class F sortase [Streptomyces griseoluteus]